MAVKCYAGSKRVDPRDLDKDESALFERAWESGVKFYNRNGPIQEPFQDEEIKQAVREVLGTVLKVTGLGFEGSIGASGIIMQPIDPMDVSGYQITAGYNTWDHAWGTANVINAWLYDKAEAVGASAYEAAAVSYIVPRDVNLDKWAFVVLGFESLAPNPVAEKIRWGQDKKTLGDFEVGSKFRNSEQQFADIRCVIAQLMDVPFQAGIYNVVAGRDAVRPVGFTFMKGGRAYQTGVNLRNRPYPA